MLVVAIGNPRTRDCQSDKIFFLLADNQLSERFI